MNPPLLTQGDVERAILATIDAMENTTDNYEAVNQAAAEAEADYKGAYAREVVHLAAVATARMTAGERDSRAINATIDQFRTWKIKEASKAATKEHLSTLRAKLDGLRTIGANIRVQT
jgi:hypothetical protein